MQENRYEQENYIVESDPGQSWASRHGTGSRSSRSSARYSSGGGFADVKRFFVTVTAIAFIIVLGLGVWTVRSALPIVGVLAIMSAVILLFCGVSWIVITVIRHATRADFYPVEENGAYLRSSLGKVTPLAPMIAAPARVSKVTGKVEITPSIPTLFDLLETGDIAPGHLEMVMGYDALKLAKGILQMVIGSWPGTHAIAGRGRSGKTRRVIGEIAQVLISGGYVIVCDPHYMKPDSLANQLAPLEKYIRIARSHEEIVAASRDFLAEMTRRETTPGMALVPWAIYYDEWARLMTTDKLEDEDRAVLIEVAENCSEQYAGFNGFCALISQAWTSETCGGTRIRRGLQAAFVHQISPEYAAFFFRARKWQNRADAIKRRECIYKNGDGEISEIATLGIPDDTASRVAVYLASIGMQGIEAPATANAPRLPEYRESGRLTMPENDFHYPQLLAPAISPMFVEGESENVVNARYEPGEEMEALQPRGENIAFQGESFTAQVKAVEYTREQETAILKAAFQIAKESNGRVTRSDIKERLGWNNKAYPVVKAVCDKHDIAKQ